MDMQANTPPDFTPKTDRDDLDLPAEQVVVAYHERTKLCLAKTPSGREIE